MADKVSIRDDVYSYRILLLEKFTARRPTDEMFKDGQSRLRQFVESDFPKQIMNIMDPHFLKEDREASDCDYNMNVPRIMECVASIVNCQQDKWK